MALTIAIEGTGVITDAESTTGWAVTGSGGITPQNETDIVLQGTQAVSCKSSGNKNAWMYYDIGAGSELDFSVGGNEEGEYVYVWFNITTIGALDTLANDSVQVRLATDTSNYRGWTLGGYNSANEFGNNYTGGWQCIVIDPTSSGTADTGTFDLTSVRYFGIYIKTLVTVKAENLIIDTIAAGKGLRITGTDVTGWQEVSDYCRAYATRAWGMMQEVLGTYFVYGTLFLGDSGQTAVTSMIDSGRKFRFGDYEYYNGTSWVSSLSNGFHGLTVEDAASFTTTFDDGILVGTDQGRSGSTFSGASEVDTTFDLYGGSSTSSTTKLYGTKFEDCGDITWGNDADHLAYGVDFIRCGQFDPVGAVKLRNCRFIETRAWRTTDVASAIAYDVSGSPSPTLETTAANNATTGDMTLLPATPATNDYYAFGSSEIFNRIEIEISTAGSGNTLAWEYSQGGGTWAALTVVDETSNFSLAGKKNVTFDPPTDWDPDAITWVGGWEGPHYFVRARVTTAGNQALGTQAWLYGEATSGALKWNSNIDIFDCQFIANADETANGDNNPAAIEHDALGTVVYDNLTFDGNDTDVMNTAAGTSVDSNPPSDRAGGSTDTLSSVFTGQAQSFTGDGSVLTACAFWGYRDIASTGTMRAYLYEHSGTFGTSSIPTGDPLAVSLNSVVAADALWVGEDRRFEFSFDGSFTLVNTTKYVIAVEITGAASSDVTMPYGTAHGGNRSRRSGSTWSAQTGDLIFEVNTGLLTVEAQNGADPTSIAAINAIAAGTWIKNLVTVRVEGLTEGAAAKVIANETAGTLVTGDVIFEKLADANGVAEITDFNYENDFGAGLDVIVRARQQGLPNAALSDDNGSYTDETTNANSSAVNDMNLLPAVPVVNQDGYIIGHNEEFGRIKLDVSTAGTGGFTITWQYWNGAWTSLSGVTDGTGSFSNAGENEVSWTIPGDWADTTLGGLGPMKFIRALFTAGSVTIVPKGRQVNLDVNKYFPFVQERTITIRV